MTWITTVERWLAAGADYRSRTDDALAGRTCVYCGDAAQTLDHIVPRSKGGSDHPDNLVPACQRCNGAKSALSLEEWAERLRADLSRVERKRVQLRGIEILMNGLAEVRPVMHLNSCIHDWQEVVGEPDAYRCSHCQARWVTAA